MKCLEKNPKKRFASVDELYAEISNLPLFQDTQPGSGPDSSSADSAPTITGSIPAWPVPARRRRAVWWGAGAVLAVAVLVVWQLMPGTRSQSSSPVGTQQVQDTSASSAATDPRDAQQEDGEDQSAVAGLESLTGAGNVSGGEFSEWMIPDGDMASVEGVPVRATGLDREVDEPVQPLLQVRPRPDDGTKCIINGYDYDSERDFRIPPGSHRLVLIHPGYPVLERTVRLFTRDTTVEYDLGTLFADRQSFDLRIALNPPSQDYLLEITLNGRSSRYSSFPVRNLRLLEGKWRFSARIEPASGHNPVQAAVDSCITFPYGGGPRIRIMNTQGEIDFGASEWKGLRAIPIQVFWSRR